MAEVGEAMSSRPREPVPDLPFSTRSTAMRLFATAWMLFVLHFAPNVVREIYPALSIGDHLSFRVDEYGGMHPDLFETEGRGWHIGNNPGASMLAAIPYAAARPLIDLAVNRVMASRASRREGPPTYESPWPMAREFYEKAWARGLDVKLALAAFVMQAFCMAITSALAVVLFFYLFRRLLASDRLALLLSLLYAFGTPVLFRTAFLNHNLMLGHLAFLGFVALWNPGDLSSGSFRTRTVVTGLAGGGAVLFDYSGLVFLATLFLYTLWRSTRPSEDASGVWSTILAFGSGAALPIGLLWFYQWVSFGHPFLPGQHWMPPVEWSDLGYQGYGLPQSDLVGALLFDYRFGLFVACPLLLAAFAYPFRSDNGGIRVARPEMLFLLGTFVGLVVFFSGSNYVRLQYNTGIRYMAPILPFLFLPAALVLIRLPRRAAYAAGIGSLLLSWPLAMYRDVESGFGMLRPVVQFLLGGFELPALRSISFLDPSAYGGLVPDGVSPLGLFALTGAVLWLVWRPDAAIGTWSRGGRAKGGGPG